MHNSSNHDFSDLPKEFQHDCGECLDICCGAIRRDARAIEAPMWVICHLLNESGCRIHEHLKKDTAVWDECGGYTCARAGNDLTDMLKSYDIRSVDDIKNATWEREIISVNTRRLFSSLGNFYQAMWTYRDLLAEHNLYKSFQDRLDDILSELRQLNNNWEDALILVARQFLLNRDLFQFLEELCSGIVLFISQSAFQLNTSFWWFVTL